MSLWLRYLLVLLQVFYMIVKSEYSDFERGESLERVLTKNKWNNKSWGAIIHGRTDGDLVRVKDLSDPGIRGVTCRADKLYESSWVY